MTASAATGIVNASEALPGMQTSLHINHDTRALISITSFVHDAGGAAIKVEVYELDVAEFGSFVAEVPPPLAIGTVTLADGSQVKGFVSEPRASQGAEDITALGGWRAFVSR